MEWITNHLTIYNITTSLLGIIGVLTSVGVSWGKEKLRTEVKSIVTDVQNASQANSPGGAVVTGKELETIVGGAIASLQRLTAGSKGRISSVLATIADVFVFWEYRY